MATIQMQYPFYQNGLSGAEITGGTRIISRNGRSGVNTVSIHSLIRLPRHNLNQKKGSLSIWFLSLEDLGTATHIDGLFGIHNKNYSNYTLLSDCADVEDFESSAFSLTWSSRWYPQLYAKFFRGSFYEGGSEATTKAFSAVGHFNLHKNNWYQVMLTWDKPGREYKIYINGILAGVSDQYTGKLEYEGCGSVLYAGNPSLCLSDITFYDDVLSGSEIQSVFHEQSGCTSQDITLELDKMYRGENKATFNWTPDPGWTQQLSLSLTQEEDLSHFYIQGNTNAPKITENGLLVETTPYWEARARKSGTDTDQVYLWSDRTFEGDICIEYEFQPMQHGGLSLLIANASGMQREDFMADYPLRTTGSMQMVCWEDVRNYHWEYFREVVDTRNDTASHVLVKNPWLRPMAYRCMREPLEIGKWHKLQYLQQGNIITCAVDSSIVMQVTDDPFNNNGPCFDFGRFAIRCMIHTKMLFRNLRVFNRSVI